MQPVEHLLKKIYWTQNLQSQPLFIMVLINGNRFHGHECSNLHEEACNEGQRSWNWYPTKCTAWKWPRVSQKNVNEAIQYLSSQGLPLEKIQNLLVVTSINYYYFKLKIALKWFCGCIRHQKDYISPEIINEIISSVLHSILADLSTALWYSIIADEATNISHNEQVLCQFGGQITVMIFMSTPWPYSTA